VDKREEMAKSKLRWFIAMRPGKRKNLPDTKAGRTQEFCEKLKASIRAKVEPSIHIIKNLF
jgi:transposase, IS5 family